MKYSVTSACDRNSSLPHALKWRTSDSGPHLLGQWLEIGIAERHHLVQRQFLRDTEQPLDLGSSRIVPRGRHPSRRQAQGGGGKMHVLIGRCERTREHGVPLPVVLPQARRAERSHPGIAQHEDEHRSRPEPQGVFDRDLAFALGRRARLVPHRRARRRLRQNLNDAAPQSRICYGHEFPELAVEA